MSDPRHAPVRPPRRDPGAPASRPVLRALEYVAGNFRHRITVTEVAGASGVTPNYLSHQFKVECDVTLTRYVHQLRVREAASLLALDRRSIGEIAYLVGYQNYRDFHRNFVKLRRISPSRFRASARSHAGSGPRFSS